MLKKVNLLIFTLDVTELYKTFSFFFGNRLQLHAAKMHPNIWNFYHDLDAFLK